MAQLLVRNLDGDVKEWLRTRAARHGRSMEEEARSILSEAVAGESATAAMGSRLAARFRGNGLEGPLPRLRRRRAVPAKVGIELLPRSRRRSHLERAFAAMVATDFHRRVLPFDADAAERAARIAATRRAAGRPVDFRDVEIATSGSSSWTSESSSWTRVAPVDEEIRAARPFTTSYRSS